MKKCKSCQSEIDPKATKCPYCQADQRNWFRRHPILTVLLVLFIIGLVGSSGNKSNSSSQEKITASKSPTQEVAITTPVPTTPLTLEGKLQQIINKVLSDQKDVKVNYDKETQIATVTYGEGSEFFDEKGMVQGAITVLVEVGQKAFKFDGINELGIVVRNKFTDSYGKENIEDAVRLFMTKEEFQKFDWNNLKYHPIYYPISRSASVFIIHPAILKNIKIDDLYLSFSDK